MELPLGADREAWSWDLYQWDFQDPKMEVPEYHIFGHILEVSLN